MRIALTAIAALLFATACLAAPAPSFVTPAAPVDTVPATVASGSAVALTTNVTSNITSISPAAGLYNCSANITLTGGATTVLNRIIGAISTVSVTGLGTNGTMPRVDEGYSASNAPFASGDVTHFIGPVRLTVASGGTVWLNVFTNFTTSTASAYGQLVCQHVQ